MLSTLPESQGHNLALTVLYVPNSLDKGIEGVYVPTGSPVGGGRHHVYPRANMAHIRQSRPDPGLGVHVKVLQTWGKRKPFERGNFLRAVT